MTKILLPVLHAVRHDDGSVELYANATLRERLMRYEFWRTDKPSPSDKRLTINLQTFTLHWISK